MKAISSGCYSIGHSTLMHKEEIEEISERDNKRVMIETLCTHNEML